MRLNSVELFYALVAAIGSENRRCEWGRGGHMHAVCMQRWLAMARPPAGAVGHGQATCKGWSAVAKAPLQGAAARGGSSLQGAATRRGSSRPRARPAPGLKGRLARKGLLPTARSQGVTARTCPQGAVARSMPARGGCPRRACKGATANGPPTARPRPALPPAQGQRRWWRRGGQRED
ncbi:hypothetical protein GW17_00062227 [Ensete ventricosum]|nr:hypothetical protein GW17_00062227 [Ensete ventricosum]